MKKFILSYIFISLILLIKNLIHLFHSAYIRSKFIINHKEGTPSKNYELKNSIISLINRANIDYHYEITAKLLSDFSYASKVDDYLIQTWAEYMYRCKHTFFWGYNLLKKCKIFSPIFKNTHNIFVTTILCLFEIIVAYLLGLYFDTTGIGNKILAFLTELGTSLIDKIL